MVNKEPARQSSQRLPEWLKRPLPKGEKYERVVKVLHKLQLTTVCSGAQCPNRGECYSLGTATFMIMGDTCTRNCRFCGVDQGQVQPLRKDEPARLAQAVKELSLQHVVITSVTRDDLPDGGAQHFADTIQVVRELNPGITIEILTPDFMGDNRSLNTIFGAHPDIFNHNIETTRLLTPEIRSGADYDRSLQVLNYMARLDGCLIIKSGFMLGLGENESEIIDLLRDLRQVGVEMLTIGQYLRPSKNNRPVHRFYRPEEFDQIHQQAIKMGFSHVAAGPFVRSSYHAELYPSGMRIPGRDRCN